VTPRPLIFVSAVSRELRSARQLVANTLTFLGYQPVWQDVFGTEGGDLRGMLREKIDECKGVVQLVGRCYGAEPPAPDEKYGRVSYTQYEAFYARERGKKVWYLFIDDKYPVDSCEPEPEDLRELQAAYRRRLQSDTHVFHQLTSAEALERSILKLRDDLTRLRRGVKQWAAGVITLLLVLLVATIWLVQAHRRQTGIIQKQGEQVTTMVEHYQKMQQALVRLAEVETQSKQLGQKLTQEEQRAAAYHVLEKDLGLPAGLLAKELPGFALGLYSRADTTPLLRARAAYALNKFGEAEKLSLEGAAQDRHAYETGERIQQERRKRAIESYVLAGQSAQKLIQYDKAMEHFREAEKLTDREHNLDAWVTVQQEIANLLIADGKYAESERLLRAAVEAQSSAHGLENPGTLETRRRLIYTLSRQSKNAEAETQARDVLKLRSKILGPEHVDTLQSRYDLGEPLVREGKFAEAESLYRDLIRVDERIFGPEDPRTLAPRVGLATVLANEGKDTEAEPLYREIIRLDEKIYGPEHPRTLNDRMNLTWSLQHNSKYEEAEKEYRDLIKLEQKIIGPEHPDTLSARLNLSGLLDDAGKYAEAESECRQIIPLEEKVLGREKQETLYTRANLAVALAGQGKIEEAQTQYRDVTAALERVVGFDHPATLSLASDFTQALVRQNRKKEAIELSRELEEKARKVLGDVNPSTEKFAKLRQDLERQ
jgi:tetratricopeptide (TPR) repeat protein